MELRWYLALAAFLGGIGWLAFTLGPEMSFDADLEASSLLLLQLHKAEDSKVQEVPAASKAAYPAGGAGGGPPAVQPSGPEDGSSPGNALSPPQGVPMSAEAVPLKACPPILNTRPPGERGPGAADTHVRGNSSRICSLKTLAERLPPGSQGLKYYLSSVYGFPMDHPFLDELAATWCWTDVTWFWPEKLPPFLRQGCIWAFLGIQYPGDVFSKGRGGYYTKRTGAMWVVQNQTLNLPDSRVPTVREGRWVEVLHCMEPKSTEAEFSWFYLGKGSGVWYWTGPTLVFAGHEDMPRFFNSTLPWTNTPGEISAFLRAIRRLGTFESVEITHQNDIYPKHVPDIPQFYCHEIIGIREGSRRSQKPDGEPCEYCPLEPRYVQGGYPPNNLRECMCDLSNLNVLRCLGMGEFDHFKLQCRAPFRKRGWR
mmetsp:Transcript_22686/g.52952  ORF Transcript_22686/g.52952 Transcript_22686/m.52952 type:complete len:425 (-) Transcript_22686:109-1383(-)